jgi:hypothetical protein
MLADVIGAACVGAALSPWMVTVHVADSCPAKEFVSCTVHVASTREMYKRTY